MVGGLFADVLAGPGVDRPLLATLPRGALPALSGEPREGWQPILLPQGGVGWVKEGLLEPWHQTPPPIPPSALRAAVTAGARRWLGVPYRWGGKSSFGVDCSGLVFLAWFALGVSLYRDARPQPGFPARPIPLSQAAPADLLYFPGHVALYLGWGRYLHATARPGSDGVVVNSLAPTAPLYRADLARSLLTAGTVFPLP